MVDILATSMSRQVLLIISVLDPCGTQLNIQCLEWNCERLCFVKVGEDMHQRLTWAFYSVLHFVR